MRETGRHRPRSARQFHPHHCRAIACRPITYPPKRGQNRPRYPELKYPLGNRMLLRRSPAAPRETTASSQRRPRNRKSTCASTCPPRRTGVPTTPNSFDGRHPRAPSAGVHCADHNQDHGGGGHEAHDQLYTYRCASRRINPFGTDTIQRKCCRPSATRSALRQLQRSPRRWRLQHQEGRSRIPSKTRPRQRRHRLRGIAHPTGRSTATSLHTFMIRDYSKWIPRLHVRRRVAR